MAESKSLYDIINGKKDKPKKHKIYSKKITLKPIPIGHYLAINIYKDGLFLDTLFVENIDICSSYTMIHFNKRVMEEYPIKMIHTLTEPNKTTVWYENNTEFEVIRIS